MGLLSIILPAYNEQESVAYAAEQLASVLGPEKIPYEIVFVDDGSSDDTYQNILKLAGAQSNIRGVGFSRNFGKEAAISAGLHAAEGDCCVVMDCDMQHPAKTVVQMYRLWQEGYQIIEGVKSSRGEEGKAHSFAANAFYGIISRMSGIDMKNSSDFKLMDRVVVDTLNTLPEKHQFFRGLSFWVGYRSTSVEYDVEPRKFGETKWSFIKLAKYAIRNLTSFSAAPLQIVTVIGVILLFLSFILMVQTLATFFMGRSATGFTTVILLLLIIGGCIMLSLGVIGGYIAKIYDEVKNRPRYIIAKDTRKETEQKQK